MTPELKALLDARAILCKAYFETIGYGPAHSKVWRAVEYIDKQAEPIIAAALEPESEAA